jgi:steroid delta-isomerase-like uncharacterized protein
MPEAKANELLVRRFFDEVWNRKDEAAIDEMLSKDSVCYGLPDPDAVARGPEAYKGLFRMLCTAFPDLQITLEDVISAGDRVAARWRPTATHLGDNLGFPATGKEVTLDGATIGVVRDGKIVEG